MMKLFSCAVLRQGVQFISNCPVKLVFWKNISR